jgi:hypothetical protein
VTLREKSLRFISNPDSWTRWPLLPLIEIRHVNDAPTRTGVLIDGHGPTVYLVNMFNTKKLSEAKKIKYDNYNALLDDWQID